MDAGGVWGGVDPLLVPRTSNDESLRIVGIQSSVNHLGLKWLWLTFPKDPVKAHDQHD